MPPSKLLFFWILDYLYLIEFYGPDRYTLVHVRLVYLLNSLLWFYSGSFQVQFPRCSFSNMVFNASIMLLIRTLSCTNRKQLKCTPSMLIPLFYQFKVFKTSPKAHMNILGEIVPPWCTLLLTGILLVLVCVLSPMR